LITGLIMSAKRVWVVLSLLLIALPLKAESVRMEATAIEAYISSLPDVEALGARLEASGRVSGWFEEMTPLPGLPFNPHQQAVARLVEQEPAFHYELNKTVISHGFTSAQRWAEIGDRVILAYGALKAERENPALWQLATRYQQLPPEMLSRWSAEAREQVIQALAIVRAFDTSPAQDKLSVAPYVSRLDSALR
jgi:hypothetical protein